jgi:cytochrome P450
VLDWVLDTRVTRHRLATVTLGNSIVVINDYELSKELFDKEEFSGRPRPPMAPHRFSNNEPEGIIHTQGQQWTTQRRFSLKTLKDFGFGRKSIEESIYFEVDEMIDSSFSGSGDICLGNDFNIPIINVLWRMVANKRFSPSEPHNLKLIDMVSFMFENGRKRDLMPKFLMRVLPACLRPATLMEARAEVIAGIRDHLINEVREHQAELDMENPKDFIDVYLTEIGSTKGQGLNVDDLTSCIYDFFMAGTETSSTTLKWAVLYLTLHQSVQDRQVTPICTVCLNALTANPCRCRAELQEMLGSSRPTVADLPRLPFLQVSLPYLQVSHIGILWPKCCSCI